MSNISAHLPSQIAALARSFGAATMLIAAPASAQQPSGQELKSPAQFMSITNSAERSRAIFDEVGKIITHPR
jgi:hypothetical protein